MIKHQTGNVTKRHGAWFVRFYQTEKTSDGTLVRKQKTQRLCAADGVTKKQAWALAQPVIDRVNRQSGRAVEADPNVVAFWDDVYWPFLQTNTKLSTQSGYEKLWNQHLVSEFTAYKLSQYRTADCSRLLSRLAESGLSSRTVSNVRCLVSGLFKFALNRGLVDANPATSAQPETKPTKPSATHAYTLAECVSGVQVLAGNLEAQAVWVLSCFGGLRAGEIAGLRWENVVETQDGMSLTVEASAWRGNVDTTKTGESRTVFLITPAANVIATLRAQAKSEWLFPDSASSKPRNVSQFAQHVIGPRLREAGVSYYGIHAGRRAAATNLVAVTGNAVAAQQLLGHANIATTMSAYIKQNPTEAIRGLRLLEAKLEERKNNGESGGGQ